MIYKPKGVCSQAIYIELDGDVIKSVSFQSGDHGKLRGIASLVKGMKTEDAIERLKGIKCGFKSTSCPDQLAQALESMTK